MTRGRENCKNGREKKYNGTGNMLTLAFTGQVLAFKGPVLVKANTSPDEF